MPESTFYNVSYYTLLNTIGDAQTPPSKTQIIHFFSLTILDFE